MRTCLVALSFGVASAASVVPAAGQTVRGRVVDSVSTKPIKAAVDLLRPDGKVVVQLTTGDDGRFELRAPGPDTLVLRVRRLGYVAFMSQPMALGAVTDTSVNPRMIPRAVVLSPLGVSAARGNQFLRDAGYYRRKQETTGYFLDPDKIEKLSMKAKQTADILDGIPGVTIATSGGSWGVRVPVLTRQMGCAGTGAGNPDESTVTGWPRIYLDGMAMNMGNQVFDVNTIQPLDILAVEVYNSVSEIPLQYGGTNATCGVLVIWTKR